jgi:hypothetical protein
MHGLSPDQRATIQKFEEERGAFLNHLAMVELVVEDIIAEFILGPGHSAEAAQVLRERFVDQMPLGRKPEVLRDVIRFSSREDDYGDLFAKFKSAIEHRNLLAHNMGPVVSPVPDRVMLHQRRGLGSKETAFTLQDLSDKTREAEALRERVFRLYVELFQPNASRPATKPLERADGAAHGATDDS